MNLQNIPRTVSSIILFGSKARMDNDVYSDNDICVVVSDKSLSNNIEILIASQLDVVPGDIVIYSEKQFNKMLKYGSLFVWHLKLEGKVLFDRGYFNNCISNLVEYNHHQEELSYHSSILDDIVSDFNNVNTVNELDLSMLFTICRNTCMILCHMNGYFTFGRSTVFATVSSFYSDLPLGNSIYDELALWKMVYERGVLIEKQLPTAIEFIEYINDVRKLLDYAFKRFEK